MAGLNDLKGLFKPKCFKDSINLLIFQDILRLSYFFQVPLQTLQLQPAFSFPYSSVFFLYVHTFCCHVAGTSSYPTVPSWVHMSLTVTGYTCCLHLVQTCFSTDECVSLSVANVFRKKKNLQLFSLCHKSLLSSTHMECCVCLPLVQPFPAHRYVPQMYHSLVKE